MLGRFRILTAVVLLAVGTCTAQQPDASLNGALASLTQRAGVIFAGEVIAIRHNAGIVEIDFRVDQSLKSASGTYTLREWAGLWAAGQRRYWLGERAVLFLHPPSSSGLSTPVDGMDGVLPLVPSEDATSAVDIRRLRTRVQREIGQPMTNSPDSLPLTTITGIVIAQLPAPAVPVHARPVRPTQQPLLENADKIPGTVRQLDAPL